MNSFGRNFRITIFGESHGPLIGITIDGADTGIPLSPDDFIEDLARRKSGAVGTTPRQESDMPEIVSGIFEGHTTGAPITILFRNSNTRSSDYARFVVHPRPSHADYVASRKFQGFNDPRGGGHFSGRLTLPLVAAGVVAKKMLPETTFETHLTKIGGSSDPSRFEEIIREAMKNGDSVGGTVECRITGIRVGMGSPFFDSAESIMSHLLFSIPAVKGVEFGCVFAVADTFGSQNNDPIVDPTGTTATNHDGGINGGLTNGNPIILRVAIKPTPSISAAQLTLNTQTGSCEELRITGRHDACIALRAAVVVEAAAAIALADLNTDPLLK